MYKNKLVEIQAKIDEIEKQIQHTECVFRGEPAYYEKVSCGVFREFNNVEEKFTLPSKMQTNNPNLIINTSGFEIPVRITASKKDIQNKQREILRDLQNRIGEEDCSDLLIMTSILQHIGHGTDLLDFTTDYRIAMFFACRKEFDEDGRVILLRRDNKRYTFHDMTQKQELRIVEGRAKAQESVLVDSPDFFIEEADQYYVCRIPKDLKIDLLEYLNTQGISETTMFPDYLGFIENEKDRREAHGYFRRGLELENHQKCEEAISCYDKAINLKYNFAGAYKHRGRIWLEKNELDRAEDDLNKALYFDPDDMHTLYTTNGVLALTEPALAHRLRSVVYYKTSKKDKALRDCSKAIDLAPNEAETYFNRGLIYAEKGELNNAIIDFSKCLEIQADNPKALSFRGKIHWQKGNINEAMADFSKSIAIQADDPEVLKLRGVGHARKGRLDEAMADFSRSIKLKKCAETKI